MTTTYTYWQLKLDDGRVVRWQGSDGIEAAERYVDTFRDATVVAWREDQTPQVRILGSGRITQ